MALSTFPWLEGHGLFAGQAVRFNKATGVLTREADGGAQTWSIIDATADGHDLKFA